MKNNESEDDFLTTLYQQSAQEKPPTDLDKQILALATENHQRRRFGKVMNLQRILSVAAVMVLSVYIFFDINEDHPAGMNQELFYPPQNMLRSSPSPASLQEQTDSLEMKQEVQVIKTLKMKQAKKSAEKENADYMADDIRELVAQEPSESDLSARSAIPVTQENLKTEPTQEIPEAEDQLKVIAQLVASGKMEQAELTYKRFKILFPEYPVPKFISESIEKE